MSVHGPGKKPDINPADLPKMEEQQEMKIRPLPIAVPMPAEQTAQEGLGDRLFVPVGKDPVVGEIGVDALSLSTDSSIDNDSYYELIDSIVDDDTDELENQLSSLNEPLQKQFWHSPLYDNLTPAQFSYGIGSDEIVKSVEKQIEPKEKKELEELRSTPKLEQLREKLKPALAKTKESLPKRDTIEEGLSKSLSLTFVAMGVMGALLSWKEPEKVKTFQDLALTAFADLLPPQKMQAGESLNRFSEQGGMTSRRPYKLPPLEQYGLENRAPLGATKAKEKKELSDAEFSQLLQKIIAENKVVGK